MVKHKKLGMAVAGACALFGASAANAFGPIKAGDWDLSVSGEVNAFYSYTHCDNNARVVIGGPVQACTPAGQGSPTNNGNSNFSSIESGLLPSALVFSAKTTQEGFDIGVTFGFYPGINNGGQVGGANSPGANIGLGNTGIDMRQNFLTFGDKEMGTIKMGRDLGLFGSDAILSDMTLLGVGSSINPSNPGNTTSGRIGYGYIYADWIPQITYITPSFDGFQVSAGIFQPINMIDFQFLNVATNSSVPMFQAKATYDFKVNEDIKAGRIWASTLYERAVAPGTGGSQNVGVAGYAGDVGVKANVYGFEPVLYYYQGRGIGTTGLFLNGFDATGQQRNSRGGYAQVSHAFGKWKPSFSYGLSELMLGSGEQNTALSAGNLVKFNKMRTQQLQYSLTKALTLVEEFSTIRSSSQGGGVNSGTGNYATVISLGAILFF
jgi:predicted porin